MKLLPVHIKSKEIIGKLKDKEVYLVTTHGGLSLVAAFSDGQLKTLGAGPHPGIAKWLAEKKEADIKWSEYLAKSDNFREMICPLCKQKDTALECLCLYRAGYDVQKQQS